MSSPDGTARSLRLSVSRTLELQKNKCLLKFDPIFAYLRDFSASYNISTDLGSSAGNPEAGSWTLFDCIGESQRELKKLLIPGSSARHSCPVRYCLALAILNTKIGLHTTPPPFTTNFFGQVQAY